MSTFEHVAHFWKGFEEVHRVLRPDGAFLVCCPFYFHIHNHPSDYWHFTPEAYHLLLESYPQRLVGWHGPKNRPLAVWALAFREEAPRLDPQRLVRYRALMNRYAHEPLRWKKKIRYTLGRLLCGAMPFAPFLDVDHWEMDFCSSSEWDASEVDARRRAGSVSTRRSRWRGVEGTQRPQSGRARRRTLNRGIEP